MKELERIACVGSSRLTGVRAEDYRWELLSGGV